MQPSHGDASPGPRSRGHAPPGGAYGAALYAPPTDVDDATQPARHGDAASEHLYMKRGRYTAWPYVVLAFIAELALIGQISALSINAVVTWLTGHELPSKVLWMIGVPPGALGAWLVFRDRWRCIEAFSSRFCVGVMNISLCFVPVVAFVYANVRGVRKLLRT